MKTLLKYDFLFLKRTSKFIVFPAIAILFAVLSPLTARYMNEILQFLLGTSGAIELLPEVTVEVSYIQYISDLFEIYLIVTIFVSVSIFMKERNRGELPLILSKPIPRGKYLISKLLSFMVVQLVALIIGGLLFSYYTHYLFGTVSLSITFVSLGLFLLYELFILSVAMFLSIYFKSYAAASVLTFVIYIVLQILGAYDKGVLDFLPGRILHRVYEVSYAITDSLEMIPFIAVILVTSFVFIALSIYKFRKYDI